MPIDMTTVKQIMHNNKEVAKIEDLNGNIMWQKPSVQITISYDCLRLRQYLPASKTVTLSGNSYALTSADIPAIDLSSSSDQIVGWTLDGSTQLRVGDTISTNVTLKAIHKFTVTKKYDWSATGSKAVAYRNTGTASASHSATLWKLNTGASASYTNSYSKSYTNNTYSDSRYVLVGIRGFNGVITTQQVYPNMKFKIKWNPAVRSVTYTKSTNYTADTFYADTYPMILVRDGNTTTVLYTNGNVAANTTTSTITSGSSSNGYITFQYGGWDAGGNAKTSWGRQYRSEVTTSTASAPSSNHSGNITDYLYLYMQ